MATSLPVVNLDTATFECTFGRGCDGICCRNGRPGVYPEEESLIADNLAKFLPELRPVARTLIEKQGFVSKRRKGGLPMLRVAESWCVFFNQGCVLHKVGATEGDKYKYKPAPCGLFPLAKDADGTWYVRQWELRGEEWDLFCLNPANSKKPVKKSLAEEIELAERYEAEEA